MDSSQAASVRSEEKQHVPEMMGRPEKSQDPDVLAQDDVFGAITENGPNYRDIGLPGAVALMMKTQIGLGVLSIPAAFDALGLVPGVIALAAIGFITGWSDYIIGVFKQRHPDVYGVDDAMGMAFGRFGKEFMGLAFILLWIFVSGSAILSVSVSLNALSDHGACTAIFVAVSAVMCFLLASIRTFGQLTWLAWVGLVCIITAVFTVTIAVGIQDRPAAAPPTGHWESDYKIVGDPTFASAMTALSSLVLAYAGVPAYFSIVSEMRNFRDYNKALYISQTLITCIYIAIGVVMYYFCGSYVASPALGSATTTIKKVSYGFALPGLMVSMAILAHIPAKHILVRVLRGTPHLTSNSFIHWATWLGLTGGVTIIAYIIASAIPVFGSLVSLIGAFFGTLMCFQPMAIMWFYDNWHSSKRNAMWLVGVLFSSFVIVMGMFIMVGGTYGSIKEIIDVYNASGGSAAWSCADNSNSS